MIESKTTMGQRDIASVQAQDRRIHNTVLKVRRFSLHLLEMLLSMFAGMPVFFILEEKIPASSVFAAAFNSRTNLYDLTHGIFMTVPMVAWMIVRRHGLRHSAEMAFAMLVPVATSAALSMLGVDDYLPWISDASHPAMFLAMILAMLYRRDHYTGKAGHRAHLTHGEVH